MNADNAVPLPEDQDADTAGDYRQVKWEVVAKTSGITPAEIIAGRLRADGIPARAWQEGAGEALGLFVGLLGMGHVVVPEEFADEARAILAEDEPWDDADDENLEED